MKKFFAIAAVALMTLTANAQVYVGGGLGVNFEHQKAADVTSTDLTIAPEVGYCFNDKWAVGLGLGYTSSDSGVEGAKTSTSFTIAPYARYTFTKVGNVSFFVDGGVGYKTYNNDGGNTFTVALQPGIKYSANDKIDFVAQLGSLGYSKDSDERGGNSSYGLLVNNNALKFGVYYNF